MTCHLGRHVVEVSASGATGRRFRVAPKGSRCKTPMRRSATGKAGRSFPTPGFSSAGAGNRPRLSPERRGVMTEVLGEIRYANGVNFDAATRTLFVSEHLGAACAGADAGPAAARHRETGVRRFCAAAGGAREHSYPLAGPGRHRARAGIRRQWRNTARGGCTCSTAQGRHYNTLKVAMPFVDTVAWDEPETCTPAARSRTRARRSRARSCDLRRANGSGRNRAPVSARGALTRDRRSMRCTARTGA